MFGLHCSIPNGACAPGKLSPMPVCTMVLTIDAGSLTRAGRGVAAGCAAARAYRPVAPTATTVAAVAMSTEAMRLRCPVWLIDSSLCHAM